MSESMAQIKLKNKGTLFLIFYSGTESIRASVWNTAVAAAAATTTARFLISS
jgi:hypothetical protein